MGTVIALTGEEKFSGQHETVTMPSLLKVVSKSRAKKTVLVAILYFLAFHVNAISADPSVGRWWNSNWNYRISLTVDVGSYERTEKPVEQYLNLTALLRRIGRIGMVIGDSLRVVEVNSNGDVIDDRVPFQYDAMTDTWGNLVFILTGTTPAGAHRYYDVYFDTAGTFTPTAVSSQVQLTDDVMDEGQAGYRIITQNATYFYQKEAGGFSSLLDIDGNDWINFHPWGGSDGIYRGIPNIVHPDNIFHPGHKNCSSSILHTGPLKVTIRTVSNNGLWECIWEVYPYHARMTLLKKADKNYWFLYEGTPGGKLDLSTDFSVRSNGIRLPVEQSWREQDIPAPEWAYFEDSVLDRYIYLVHEEDDSLSDDFWQMQSNMTVFGFGRTQNVNDKQLSGVPMHFTIGLSDDATFSSANKVIEGSYRPVNITVGDPVAQAIHTTIGTNVKIGASSDSTDRFFEGFIDSVRVYERAVSSTDIRDMSRGAHVDADDSGSRIELEQGHGELRSLENNTYLSVEREKEKNSAITRHVSPRRSAVRSTGGLRCRVKISSFRNEPMDLLH